MKFLAIAASLLVSSVVAAPYPSATESSIEKRSPDSILAALTTLESSVTALNNSLNTFNPTSLTVLGGLLTVLNNSDAVGNSIIAVTKQVNQTGVLNSDDSFTVGIAFLGFQPQVDSLIQNLITVRPKVDKVGGIFSARKTVLSALQNDKYLTDILITALYNNLDPSLQPVVPGVQSDIDSNFDAAIKNYNTAKKGIDLPAIPSNTRNNQVVNY